MAVGWLTYAFTTGILSFYGQRYFQMIHRSLNSFANVTKAMILKSALAVVLVVAVYFWGFYGLCLRSLVTSAVGAFVMLVTLPMRAKLSLSWKRLWRLLRVGLPIFAVGYVYSLWSTLDSTLVVRYLGAEGLGLYSLSGIVQATLGILPSALGQVIYPSMSEEYGRSGSLDTVLGMTIRPTLAIAAVSVPLVGISWRLLPIFVNLVLPQYAGGVGAAQWGMVVIALRCLQIPNNAFNVLQKQTWYGVAIGAGIGAYLCALYLLSQRGLQIETFPQALVVGKVVFLLISYGMLFWLWRQERKAKT